MRKRCRDKNHPLRAAAPRFFQLGGKAALPSAMDIIFIYVAGNQFDCLPHLLLPLGLTKPLVEPGVDKKALANKTSMLQSRWFGNCETARKT